MSDGRSLNGGFVPLCPEPVSPGVHVIAAPLRLVRKVLLWGFSATSHHQRGTFPAPQRRDPSFLFMQLISFSLVGRWTKYYLHYVAALISPPRRQVLMTQVTELQSAFTARAMPPLTVIILSRAEPGHLPQHKHHYWGPKKNISINLNEASLTELS